MVELTGASVAHSRDDEQQGVGQLISSYLWEASGPAAVTITGASTATPTFTFTAAGTYLIRLTVSALNGKSFSGYRKTVVHDAGHPAGGATSS